MIDLDIAKTVELLDEIVVEAGPGAKTQNCLYVIPDHEANYVYGDPKPSCIVGQIVYKVGGAEALLKLEEISNANSRTNAAVLSEIGFTYEAINFLQGVQEQQDRGTEWAEVLDDLRPDGV